MPIQWNSEKRNISDLKLAEYNPRQASEKDIKDLSSSIDRFNLADPIIINKNNNVIGGHFRIRILKDKGITEADVRVPDTILTEDQEKELNLRLNKNLGDWDFDGLANFDEEMLKDVGFDSDELDKIFQLDDDDNADDVPEVRDNTDIKLGDIFELGGHRLACGDSTKREDVEKLMAGQKADMVFTDPPYNCDYGSSKVEHKAKPIAGDKQSDSEWIAFNQKLIDNIKLFYKGGDIYIWGASSGDGMRQRVLFIDSGFHWSATIVWKKNRLVLSPAKYQRLYEPCFYGWFDKSSYCGNRKQVEVWEEDRPSSSKQHPTMKPIIVCERGIFNSTSREDIVLDFFGGSGSTLIACERLNRKCYMMELDPKYCQVIIDRWEKYTNQKATKVQHEQLGQT